MSCTINDPPRERRNWLSWQEAVQRIIRDDAHGAVDGVRKRLVLKAGIARCVLERARFHPIERGGNLVRFRARCVAEQKRNSN